MPLNVKITAILVARQNRAEELKALLLHMDPLCRAEFGNLQWDLWQDQEKAGAYVLDEMYLDDAAVVFDHQTSHYMHHLSVIPDLADRTGPKPLFVAPSSGSCGSSLSHP